MNPTFSQRSIHFEPTTTSHSRPYGPSRTVSSISSTVSEDVSEPDRRSSIFGYQVVHPSSVSNTSRPPSEQSGAQDALFQTTGDLKNLAVSSGGSSPGSVRSRATASSFDSLHSSNLSTLISARSDSSYPPPSKCQSPIAPPIEKMVDYNRYPRPIQPPSIPHMQSQNTMLPSSTSIMGRGDSYAMAYPISRNSLSVAQATGSFDTTRYHQYPARTNDLSMNGLTNGVYGTPGWDPPQRLVSSMDSPPWNDTEVYYTVVANGQVVKPEIQARIHKGFFLAGGYWTCYRRNYFSVSLSFVLRPWSACTSYFIQRQGHAPEKIQSFSMKISAFVNGQEKETRELIQHTPKRDKQSESKPRRAVLQPQPPPSLLLNHGANTAHLNFGLPPAQSAISMDYGSSYGGAQQTPQIPTSHTWERIQFQKATANNGKRRAQQQFYNLVAELWVEVPDLANGTEYVMLARKLSNPVVVRGRSPGHYKDAKRDTSGRIGNGDADVGNSSMSHLALHTGLTPQPPGPSRPHLSSMTYDPTPRNASQIDYRRMPSTDQSPLTASSLISSSSSSPGYDSLLNDPLATMQPMASASSMDGYGQPTFSFPGSSRTVRCVLPSFDDTAKSQDQNEVSLSEQFEMMPILNNDHNGTNQFLTGRASNGYASQDVHRPASGGRLTSYSTRPDEHSYGRYEPIHNSHI